MNGLICVWQKNKLEISLSSDGLMSKSLRTVLKTFSQKINWISHIFLRHEPTRVPRQADLLVLTSGLRRMTAKYEKAYAVAVKKVFL
jgi:hypothetical protein